MGRQKIDLSDASTFVICPVCDQKMRTLSWAHTKLHNMLPSELVAIYKCSISCVSTKLARRDLISLGVNSLESWTDERREKVRVSGTNNLVAYNKSEEHREMCRRTVGARQLDPNYRNRWIKSIIVGAANRSEDAKFRASEGLRKLWSNPESRKVQIKRISLKSRDLMISGNLTKRRATYPELCISVNVLGLRFVGTGELWITSHGRAMNPDFVVEDKSKKRVVEFFGDYWHQGGDAEAQQRIQLFRDVGWDCLVVWGHDFYNNAETVYNKIRSFVSGGTTSDEQSKSCCCVS